MITQELIDKAVRALVEAAHPVKIVLFGSYALGQAAEDSDLDFLVVQRGEPHQFEEMIRMQKVLRPLRIPVEVLVIGEEDYLDMIRIPGTVYYWAHKEGRVLYDAA